MIITSSITIYADINRVWDTFTDLTCWKDWNTVITEVEGGKPARLTDGALFNFCIRPFVLPVRLTPVVEELVPLKKITWTGKKFGLLARHEFFLEESHGGVKVTSVETFIGPKAFLAGLKVGKQRLQSLSSLLLAELKKACEPAIRHH